jgi:hypothetical protein
MACNKHPGMKQAQQVKMRLVDIDASPGIEPDFEG